MKKLLIETHAIKISPSQITEDISGGNAPLLVEGVLATAEVKNGNGRYYSKGLWEREMDKYNEAIKQLKGEDGNEEEGEIDSVNIPAVETQEAEQEQEQGETQEDIQEELEKE